MGLLVAHAAEHHGVQAVGITLSQEQAEYARKRIFQAGLSDRVEIRVQDWRDLTDDPFDAVASIGMAEHPGRARAEYARTLHDLPVPAALLNHQIVRRPGPGRRSHLHRRPFSRTGSCCRSVTSSTRSKAAISRCATSRTREHYARTLRRWVANLEANGTARSSWPAQAGLGSGALHDRVGASFDAGRIGVAQVLAVRRHGDGPAASRAPAPRGSGSREPARRHGHRTRPARDHRRRHGGLADLGINLEDSSMTLLRGHFAMTLVCAGDLSLGEVERALAPLAADGSLLVTVRSVPAEAVSAASGNPYLLTVHGGDRPGIVSAVTRVLADSGGNIIDLTTRLTGDMYLLVAEVDLPASVDTGALAGGWRRPAPTSAFASHCAARRPTS